MERLVYSYQDKNMPNPRMVYGVGFMLFAFVSFVCGFSIRIRVAGPS